MSAYRSLSSLCERNCARRGARIRATRWLIRGKQQRFRHLRLPCIRTSLSRHDAGVSAPGSVFFYFAAPSADLAFGLASGALAAAFGGALSLRTVPQGSKL